MDSEIRKPDSCAPNQTNSDNFRGNIDSDYKSTGASSKCSGNCVHRTDVIQGLYNLSRHDRRRRRFIVDHCIARTFANRSTVGSRYVEQCRRCRAVTFDLYTPRVRATATVRGRTQYSVATLYNIFLGIIDRENVFRRELRNDLLIHAHTIIPIRSLHAIGRLQRSKAAECSIFVEWAERRKIIGS